jgi:outer membrane protein OmpA-like peptidoglycan-associated protein
VKKNYIIFCIFFISVSLYAEVFTFKYNQGEKYKIVSVVDESIYLDGIFHHQARILNKISVEVIKAHDNGSGDIDANYSTSEERSGNVQVYALAQEYYSSFNRDTWEMEGYEVHDLRAVYGIEEAFSFPVKVKYKYLGKGEKDGNEYDIISIFYSISERSSDYYSQYPIYPVKITGYSDQTLYWDNFVGRPYAYEEEFSIQFYLSNGRINEFTGTAGAKVTESEFMDKNLIVRDIEMRLEKERLEKAVVNIDENGVTITLGSISFGADSSTLSISEKKKLNVIIDILKNYPERDVLITGHTALAGTVGGRLELSKQRASMVAEYFFTEGAKRRDQLLIIGKGASDPLADNSSAEGMSLNRRVEITIVEN